MLPVEKLLCWNNLKQSLFARTRSRWPGFAQTRCLCIVPWISSRMLAMCLARDVVLSPAGEIGAYRAVCSRREKKSLSAKLFRPAFPARAGSPNSFGNFSVPAVPVPSSSVRQMLHECCVGVKGQRISLCEQRHLPTTPAGLPTPDKHHPPSAARGTRGQVTSKRAARAVSASWRARVSEQWLCIHCSRSSVL